MQMCYCWFCKDVWRSDFSPPMCVQHLPRIWVLCVCAEWLFSWADTTVEPISNLPRWSEDEGSVASQMLSGLLFHPTLRFTADLWQHRVHLCVQCVCFVSVLWSRFCLSHSNNKQFEFEFLKQNVYLQKHTEWKFIKRWVFKALLLWKKCVNASRRIQTKMSKNICLFFTYCWIVAKLVCSL